MKRYLLAASVFGIAAAQQYEITIDQDCFPDSFVVQWKHHEQDLSPSPVFETNTRAQQAKLTQQEQLESKAYQHDPQLCFYKSIINEFARYNKKVKHAKKEANHSERKYDRLQDKADRAQLKAELLRNQVQRIQSKL